MTVVSEEYEIIKEELDIVKRLEAESAARKNSTTLSSLEAGSLGPNEPVKAYSIPAVASSYFDKIFKAFLAATIPPLDPNASLPNNLRQ